ncbi:MAG: UMP kinase [Gammaproteobacteria bacterium]|nr:UMP kinase [Gammaproteobacteria bacterium]
MLQTKPLYRRILLKMSGEALMGESQFGIAPQVLGRIVTEIAELCAEGIQVALVIGGGNLFRGAALSEAGLGRVTGDYMGMLATVMNALAFRDVLETASIPTRIMSAITMTGVVDPYDRRKAIYHLENGRVVIFSAGTGNPFFTTDSAASLRAIEIDADILLKATKVDGIYSADPMKHPDAVRYNHLSYTQVLEQDLKVMDSTAICMCRDHNMPLRVFNLDKAHAVKNIIFGAHEGTLVSGEKK